MTPYKKLREVTGGVDRALLERGRLGRGVVTHIEPSGAAITIGGEPHRVCELDVQVSFDGERPYHATVRQRVPVAMLTVLAAGGARITVRVDHADPRRIALDLGAAS